MQTGIVALILLLLLFLANCCKTEHLEVPIPPSPQCMEEQGSNVCVGVAGHSLTIPCGNHTENTNGVEFIYSQQVPALPRPILVTRQTQFLELNVTRADHNSWVRCRTNTSFTEEYDYWLNITYKPHQIDLKRVPRVTLGEPLALSCPIDANPPADYTWTAFKKIDAFKQKDLPASLVYLSDDHRSWKVDVWTTDYNGYYVCCASNVLGETCFRNITNYFFQAIRCITVARPTGTISVFGSRTDYPLGAKIELQCQFNNVAFFGQPPTWFHWTGGKYQLVNRLRDGYELNISHSDFTCVWNSLLTITSLTRQQAGVYRCERNTIGVNTTVTLEACTTNMKEDFQIQPLKNSVPFEGSLVTVTCLVKRVDKSHPPHWCRNNGTECIEVQNIAGVFQNLTSFDTGNCTWIAQLEIPSLNRDTQGEYSCFIPGTNHSQNITLDLQEQSAMNVAAISVGSVVAVLVLFAVLSFIGLVLAIGRSSTFSYARLKEPPMRGFNWDVFLSYHTEAEEFVLTHVKIPLESQQPAYKICWHHVDFLAGRTILDNINEAVEKSRKIVFVFSKDFSKSEYCMAELARALDRLQHTQTSCIVPIVLDEGGVPSKLKSKVTYWPVIRPDTDFTKKLVSYIGPPTTLSCTVQK